MKKLLIIAIIMIAFSLSACDSQVEPVLDMSLSEQRAQTSNSTISDDVAAPDILEVEDTPKTETVPEDQPDLEKVPSEVGGNNAEIAAKPENKSAPEPKNNEVSAGAQSSHQTEATKPKTDTQSEPSKPAETSPPAETPAATETPPAPQFDINEWISYAKNYATSIGLKIESSAVDCWDNPIIAGANSAYVERDIQSRLNRYAKDEDITDVWVWAVVRADGAYDLFIGYA